MAAALLIAEFARRHIARGADWGRIIGLTSGGGLGFPEEVSYGAAKAAQVNYTMSAALELAPYGITANMVHPPVTDTGWVTARSARRRRQPRSRPRGHTSRGRRGHQLPGIRRRRPDHRQRHHPPLTGQPGTLPDKKTPAFARRARRVKGVAGKEGCFDRATCRRRAGQ